MRVSVNACVWWMVKVLSHSLTFHLPKHSVRYSARWWPDHQDHHSLAQGHCVMKTWGAGDQTANTVMSGWPALPPASASDWSMCSHTEACHMCTLTHSLSQSLSSRKLPRVKPFSRTRRKILMQHFSLLLQSMNEQMSHFDEGLLPFISTNYSFCCPCQLQTLGKRNEQAMISFGRHFFCSCWTSWVQKQHTQTDMRSSTRSVVVCSSEGVLSDMRGRYVSGGLSWRRGEGVI